MFNHGTKYNTVNISDFQLRHLITYEKMTKGLLFISSYSNLLIDIHLLYALLGFLQFIIH